MPSAGYNRRETQTSKARSEELKWPTGRRVMKWLSACGDAFRYEYEREDHEKYECEICGSFPILRQRLRKDDPVLEVLIQLSHRISKLEQLQGEEE